MNMSSSNSNSNSNSSTTAMSKAFGDNVNRYLDLEASLSDLQVKSKAIKKEHNALGLQIISYMQSANKQKCETDTVNLIVSESVSQRPLSVALLKEVFTKYFPTRPDMPELLCKAIEAQRRHGGPERTRLKRVKRRKTKE